MKQRHTIIPAVYVILEKDTKILLLRRYNTGYEDGKYSLVAGHVDQGESFTQTLVREAKEEAGITVAEADLEFVHAIHRRWCGEHTEERIDVFFRSKKWSGEIQNMEPHKCDDLSWFAYNDLPKNMVAHVKKVLEHVAEGVQYSQFGW